MKKQYGFTLIELMIVVVIVAILAAVAVPSYQESIKKSRRADGMDALTSAAALQERYFFTNNAYAATVAALGVSGTSSEGYYTISVVGGTISCGSGANTYPCYTMRAAATGVQASDTACATLEITHTGKKSAKDSGGTDADCW